MKKLMTTANLTILNWLKNKFFLKVIACHTDRNLQSTNRLWIPAIAAFLLSGLCSVFFFQIVRVQGASMEPALYHNDWVVSQPQAYQTDSPERGDVILIRRPELTRGYIVKRVIGLPGETVEIREGNILINGELLDDPYNDSGNQDSMEPLLVQPECYFVLGDNRAFSRDSRDWNNPLVQKRELRGKVIYSLFPWKVIHK